MATTRLRFLLDNSVNTSGVYYLDLWRNVSIQERKLCRQMQVAQVMGGLIKDSNNGSVVRMNVAPDTWMTRTAVRRGFKIWSKMLKEGTEGLEDGMSVITPKYHDFKVLLNSTQSVATNSPIVSSPTIVDASGTVIPTGEWGYSQYISEDIAWAETDLTAANNRNADDFRPMIVGAAHIPGTGGQDVHSRVSLLKSWLDTRPVPRNEPNTASTDAMSTDPLVNLFDEADTSDEIIGMLQDINDAPPYGTDSFNGVLPDNPSGYGDNLQRVAFAASQNGAGQVSSLNGFSAICGLVQVHVTQDTAGIVELLLDVNVKGAKV